MSSPLRKYSDTYVAEFCTDRVLDHESIAQQLAKRRGLVITGRTDTGTRRQPVRVYSMRKEQKR